MGGFGSGRDTYARTPTVEVCSHLESDVFSDMVDDPDVSHVDLKWSDTRQIRAFVEHAEGGEYADAVRLTYTVRPESDDAREYEYRVALDYTECNFGGVRPWFRCPQCGTRRGKLYLPPRRERFACRECYELGYQSSRSSGNDLERAEQRYRKAFATADKDGRHRHPESLASPIFPEKPKGMHQETFDELMQDVEDAREEWYETFNARLRAMAGAGGVDV